jgi:TonB family protein
MKNKLFTLAFACVQFGVQAWAAGPVPEFSSCTKPVWPKEALRNEYQGTVTLSFLIGEDGVVRKSRVTKSSGYPILDLAAQEGLDRCKFKPGTENGKPVEAWTQMQYVWTLDGPNAAQMATALTAARAGAERGEAAAQHKLGLIYLNGQGVPRDRGIAKEWLLKAAAQGSPEAQQTLGVLAMPRDGEGDINEAMSWFRKAADQGHARSQYFLGAYLYKQGDPEARTWLDKAARQGDAGAQTALAQLLVNGGRAEEQADAVALLVKAAAQDERNAQLLLGQRYETGNGVTQDYAQAARLYNKAAVAGNQPAKLALARLREKGLGVPEDSGDTGQLRAEPAKAGAAAH